MKSLSFILCLLLSGTYLYAQNDADERVALSKKMLSTANYPDDLSRIGTKWNQFFTKYGSYPDLPLDQNKHVRYTFTTDFGQTTKENLFNHTLEWLAINYAMYPSNLYSNLNDGKIVLSNSFTINGTYSCNYTGIISIKNGKMLVEFLNINYQEYIPAHNSGDIYVAEKTTNFSINQVFPVILKDPSEWKFNLNLLKAVNDQFKSEIANLNDYLSNYESYNSF